MTSRVPRDNISMYLENHRMIEAGRDSWKSPGPAAVLKRGHVLLSFAVCRDVKIAGSPVTKCHI